MELKTMRRLIIVLGILSPLAIFLPFLDHLGDISIFIFSFGLLCLIVLIALVILYRKRGKSVPTELRLTASPTVIIADGKSRSTLTVELLNAEGNPTSTTKDIKVSLETTLGKVSSSIIIKKDNESRKVMIISSEEAGIATITATSNGLKGTSTEVTLLKKEIKEKKEERVEKSKEEVEIKVRRYCMHCGAQMLPEAIFCSMCGKQPPSGLNVKICKNCGEVIPKISGFCSNCGAYQPE